MTDPAPTRWKSVKRPQTNANLQLRMHAHSWAHSLPHWQQVQHQHLQHLSSQCNEPDPQTSPYIHNTIQPRSTHYITSHNIEEHPVSRLGNMPWAHPSASPMNMNKSCIELHACSRSSTGICSGGTLKACAMHGSTWRLQHAATGFSMFLLNAYYEMMTPTLQIIRM